MNLDSLLPNLTAERERLDRVIQAIQSRNDEAQIDASALDRSVKADRYKGVSTIQAAREYVREHRGFKVTLAEIVDALVKGSADPGKPRPGQDSGPASLHSHNLKIGIPNDPHTFDWTPKDVSKKGVPIIRHGIPISQVTVWLADTADIAKARKRSKGSTVEDRRL